MRVVIDDNFAVPRNAFEALFFDEAFNVALGEALKMGRKLLRLDHGSNRIVRHVYYEPVRDPDSPADRAFGRSRAGFTEELDYDLVRHEGTWRTIPNVFTDRVRNQGTIELVETTEGVRRSVRAEVTVSLFGFGRLVERMIVAEIVKSYASTTAFTNEWLARAR
jgi:hypothetical protein